MLKKIKNYAKGTLLAGGFMFLSFLTPQAHNQYLRYEVGTSVVQVLSPTGGGGTGFAVQADSGAEYIMTNRHVCEVAQNGWLVVKQGKNGKGIFKRVIYKDNKHDICLIEGDRRLDPLEIGKGLYIGESMHIVGHPGLRALTVSNGEYIGNYIVKLVDDSAKTREQCHGTIQELPPFLQSLYGIEFVCLKSFLSYSTTAVAYGGNSGSPVVNKYGNVIGILFAGNPQQNTDNFVVPVYEIKRVLSKF